MGRWLDVTEGGTDRPSPVRRDVDAGLVLARAYEIVAHGIVNGTPWLIQAFATGPDQGEGGGSTGRSGRRWSSCSERRASSGAAA